MATTGEESQQASSSSHRAILDQKILNDAGELTIYDEQGNEVAFKSLYANKRQVLIVFIRHFFCGACELYVRALHGALTPSEGRTDITVIGCGSSALIPAYRTRTGLPNTISFYADPSLTLYSKLGMRTTTSPFTEGMHGHAAQEAYHGGRSFWSIVVGSMWNAIKSGTKVSEGGPPGQNGGVVVVRDGACVFVHRMRRVDDYADLGELETVLKEGEGNM